MNDEKKFTLEEICGDRHWISPWQKEGILTPAERNIKLLGRRLDVLNAAPTIEKVWHVDSVTNTQETLFKVTPDLSSPDLDAKGREDLSEQFAQMIYDIGYDNSYGVEGGYLFRAENKTVEDLQDEFSLIARDPERVAAFVKILGNASECRKRVEKADKKISQNPDEEYSYETVKACKAYAEEELIRDTFSEKYDFKIPEISDVNDCDEGWLNLQHLKTESPPPDIAETISSTPTVQIQARAGENGFGIMPGESADQLELIFISGSDPLVASQPFVQGLLASYSGESKGPPPFAVEDKDNARKFHITVPENERVSLSEFLREALSGDVSVSVLQTPDHTNLSASHTR